MAERSTKPIMFVHPDADTKEVRALLKRAGYVVVVTASPPEHFRVLPQMPIAPASILGQAALETVQQTKSYWGDDLRKEHAQRVVRALAAMEDAIHG